MVEEIQDLILCLNNRLQLNTSILKTILSSKNGDKQIFPISIIGERNCGKSFFMNYFLMYLKSGRSEDWLKKPDEYLVGFDWNPNSSTKVDWGNKAVQIFPKMIEMDKFSIILLDIQFDGENCETDHRLYGALQTFCIFSSSLTIYMATEREDLNQIDWLSGNIEKVSNILKKLNLGKFQLVRNYFYPGYEENFDVVYKLLPVQLESIDKIINLPNLFLTSYKPEGSFQGEMKFMNKLNLKTAISNLDQIINSKNNMVKGENEISSQFTTIVEEINKNLDLVTKQEIVFKQTNESKLPISQSLHLDCPKIELKSDPGEESSRNTKNISSNVVKKEIKGKKEKKEILRQNFISLSVSEDSEKIGSKFRQVFLENPKYFAISSKRVKFSKIWVEKLSSQYGEEMISLVETKCSEAIESLKLVIFALEKFTSMAENEFESSIAFEEKDLKICLQRDRKFSENKYVRGENQENDGFFTKCLEELEENYIQRNNEIQKYELEISEKIFKKAEDFFIEERTRGTLDLNEIIQATLGAYGASIQRKSLEKIWSKWKSELEKSVQKKLELEKTTHISKQNTQNFPIVQSKITPEENYGKVLERSVKIYESEMDRMSKIPNFDEMICKEVHENCRRKAMENFYSNVEENSSNLEYFGQELEDGIEKYYKKILNQIPKLKPIKEIVKIFSSQTEPKNMMIGIHFGAKNIRCSIFQNSKFVQIPNKNGKFAIPNCVAFENNKVLFGGAALDYYKKVTSSPNCYNFNEMKLEIIEQNIFNRSIKQVLGIILSNVKLMAEDFLNTMVHSCVISVPSSVDFNFRKELLTASQIAGFEKTHILSEAVAAGYLYAFKRKEYPDTSKLLVTYSAKNQIDVTSLLIGIRGITVCSTSGLHKLKYLKNKNSSRIKSITNWGKSVLGLSEADESYIFCDAIELSNFSKFDKGIQLRDCNYSERNDMSNLFQEKSIELAGQIDPSDGVSYGTGLLAYQLDSGYLAPSAIKELSPFDNFFINRANPFDQSILNGHKSIRKLMCQEMSVDPNVIQMCQLEEGIKRLSEKIEELEGILKNQRIDGSDIHEIIQRSKNCLDKFDVTLPEADEHFSRLLSSWEDVLAIMK